MTSALLEADSVSQVEERLDSERKQPVKTPVPRRSRGKAAVFGLLCAAIFAAGVLWRLESGESEAAAAMAVPLRLEAEASAQDGEILLHWNRDASALRRGARLVLRVEDDGRLEDIELPPDLIELGAATYQPAQNLVRLRLFAKDRVTGRILDQNATSVAYVEFPSAPQETPIATASLETQPEEAVQTAVAAPEPPAPREFVAPSLGERQPAPTLAAAPALDSIAAAPLRAAPAQGAVSAPPPPAAPSRQAQLGRVAAPVLIRQVQPVYPPVARQARIEGVVRVRITVDALGRVAGAEALDGPSALRASAVQAVRQWLYRPAQLNGEPVTTSLQVNVAFRLD